MKKHLKKLRPLLLLLVLFMLTNCSEEHDVIVKANEQQATAKKKHKRHYGADAIEKRNILINNLKKEGGKGLSSLRKTMNGGTTMKTKMEDIENLIDYSEVYEVDQGNGVIHYTYMLNHPDTSEGKFFNIILKTYGSLEKAIMVTYSMDSQFINDYNLNGDFTKFTGTITYEPITYDSGFPCDEEPNIQIPVKGGAGPGGSGTPGNGGTSSPGAGSDGNPYNQALVDAKFLALQIIAWSNPEYGEPWDGSWIKAGFGPYGTTDPELLDPTNPCGDEEETGIIEPNHQKNCEELKNKSQDANFQSKINDLTAKAASQNFESAYTMYQNASTGLVLSSEAVGTSTAPEVQLNMSQSQTETYLNCIGFMHCHLDNGTTFSIFSFSDIIGLASVADVSTRPQSELAVFLTSASGTFALKVTDKIALKNNLTRMQLGQYAYEQDFAKYVDLNKSVDEQTLGFLKFMNEKFSDIGLGVSLYQQDRNGDWEKLTPSSNGKQINRKKC